MRRTTLNQPPVLSTWPTVFLAFAYIGATSFGGGSATVSAMRKLCLKRGWLTEEQFTDAVLLSRLTPGIGILAQVLLIGRSACGVPGMIAGTLGLMLPSVAITVALAWLYKLISHVALARGPLHAIVAVAAGFTVALTIELLRDVLRRGRFSYGVICFAAYVIIASVVSAPLITLGIAIAIALLVPKLFDIAESAKSNRVSQDISDHES